MAKNVKPVKISRWTEFSDPSIYITESIYVQVGIDYIMVVRDRPSDLEMYETSENVDDVIAKLLQAIEEGK